MCTKGLTLVLPLLPGWPFFRSLTDFFLACVVGSTYFIYIFSSYILLHFLKNNKVIGSDGGTSGEGNIAPSLSNS